MSLNHILSTLHRPYHLPTIVQLSTTIDHYIITSRLGDISILDKNSYLQVIARVTVNNENVVMEW